MESREPGPVFSYVIFQYCLVFGLDDLPHVPSFLGENVEQAVEYV